jgi:hypothetical protein
VARPTYYADNLLTAIRDYAELSPNAESAQDAALLRALNREQRLFLATLLEKCKQQHKQATLDVSADGSTTRFNIPVRAIAAGIKMVEGIGSTGVRWMLHELPDDEYARGWPRNGDFYFEGNQIVFYRAPASGTLRFTYSRRLSDLVAVASVGVITAISSGTITISAAPSDFETASAAYDFVKATPHFDILAMDKNATRSSTTMTFTAADVPSSLAVGDYVCQAGESAVCQAPIELHDVLALRVAYVLSAGKNDSVADRCEKLLGEAMRNAASLLNPRSTTEAVLINPNSPGFQRGRRHRTSGVAP